jgi:transcriptional regulator with PAS, ATPase and Fis domain
MFGIAGGVATGVRERPGKFQLASGGTLFLDEIGDMPPALQAKLLRVLQGREVEPVGGVPTRVDVRVITATNCDLERRIAQGQFRRDLYYRVAGFLLRVPPLRERREDIPPLVNAFLSASARDAGRPVPPITCEAIRALVDYDWPGNIRELEHEVRRLVYLCPERHALDTAQLSERIANPRPRRAIRRPR